MTQNRNEIEQPTRERIVEVVREHGLTGAAAMLKLTRKELAVMVARRGIDLVGELAPASYLQRSR